MKEIFKVDSWASSLVDCQGYNQLLLKKAAAFHMKVLWTDNKLGSFPSQPFLALSLCACVCACVCGRMGGSAFVCVCRSEVTAQGPTSLHLRSTLKTRIRRE